MKFCGTNSLRILFCGWMLLAAVGCQIQRTGHGILCRGRWSLELDTRRPSEIEAEQAKAASCDAVVANDSHPKPELLPWRSRLKGYRLAQRILHRDDAGSSDSSAVVVPPAPSVK